MREAGGRVFGDAFLQIPEWPGVWAVGDCAFVPDVSQTGRSHPPTAQHAIREGRVVAQNIAFALAGRPPNHCPSRHRVARLPWPPDRASHGFSASNFSASSRGGYGAQLPEQITWFRQEGCVAFDWTLDLLFRKDVARS